MTPLALSFSVRRDQSGLWLTITAEGESEDFPMGDPVQAAVTFCRKRGQEPVREAYGWRYEAKRVVREFLMAEQHQRDLVSDDVFVRYRAVIEDAFAGLVNRRMWFGDEK